MFFLLRLPPIDYAQICLDLNYKDYITYQGEIIDRSGGMHNLSTVVIYDDSGKEIKLWNSGDVGKETYQWYGDTYYMGTVIYGRRSHVVPVTQHSCRFSNFNYENDIERAVVLFNQ